MSVSDKFNAAAVVLAGVHRWRDAAFETLLPRPLIPLANSPLICYALRSLRDAGVRNITICANSDSPVVRACLGGGERFGLRLSYFEDCLPRGPAGCVHDAAATCDADVIIVVEGCVLWNEPLTALAAEHCRSRADLTLAAQPRRAGTPTGLVPAGAYVFSRETLQKISPRGYQDIKETLIPRLHREGATIAVHRFGRGSTRVDGLAAYFDGNAAALRAALSADEPPGYQRRGEALIHETARVSAQATLEGALIIGPDARIEAGATIVGPSAIGEGTQIAAGALLSRSITWRSGRLAPGAQVDLCVVGARAEASAGQIWFNRFIAPGNDRKRRPAFSAARSEALVA